MRNLIAATLLAATALTASAGTIKLATSNPLTVKWDFGGGYYDALTLNCPGGGGNACFDLSFPHFNIYDASEVTFAFELSAPAAIKTVFAGIRTLATYSISVAAAACG